mmetsp:Transcript_211/g.268  ORF Transcript_211/g.268 Transcript_211/m.268 type:complete len:81 (+) Transcript_211:98-340(+)
MPLPSHLLHTSAFGRAADMCSRALNQSGDSEPALCEESESQSAPRGASPAPVGGITLPQPPSDSTPSVEVSHEDAHDLLC